MQGAGLVNRRGNKQSGKASRGMGKVTLVLVLVVVLVALGGGLFLAVWDFHVPRAEVQKILPDARFPK
jgi:hypothetical protein